MARKKQCEACATELIFLENPKTGKFVPVEIESIDEDELMSIDMGEEIQYRAGAHVNHYLNCTDPNRFTKNKQKQ